MLSGTSVLTPLVPGFEKIEARAKSQFGNVKVIMGFPALRQIITSEKYMRSLGSAVILRIKMIAKLPGVWLIPIAPRKRVDIIFVRCPDWS